MISNQVSDFIDDLDDRAGNNPRHIILLYEEPEFSQTIQYRFLKNGLHAGEHCVIASCDDTAFLKYVYANPGLDIERYRAKNQLRIHKLQCDSERNQAGYIPRLTELVVSKRQGQDNDLSDRTLISHSLTLDERNNMRPISDMESAFTSYFRDSINELALCCYQLDDFEHAFDSSWMSILLKNHQGVIYMPKAAMGVALNINSS